MCYSVDCNYFYYSCGCSDCARWSFQLSWLLSPGSCILFTRPHRFGAFPYFLGQQVLQIHVIPFLPGPWNQPRLQGGWFFWRSVVFRCAPHCGWAVADRAGRRVRRRTHSHSHQCYPQRVKTRVCSGASPATPTLQTLHCGQSPFSDPKKPVAPRVLSLVQSPTLLLHGRPLAAKAPTASCPSHTLCLLTPSLAPAPQPHEPWSLTVEQGKEANQ